MLEDRFRHRLQHLQAVCKALPNNTFDKCEERAVKGNLYNVSHGIVYCSIEKSGSTFIRRILKVIKRQTLIKILQVSESKHSRQVIQSKQDNNNI